MEGEEPSEEEEEEDCSDGWLRDECREDDKERVHRDDWMLGWLRDDCMEGAPLSELCRAVSTPGEREGEREKTIYCC